MPDISQRNEQLPTVNSKSQWRQVSGIKEHLEFQKERPQIKSIKETHELIKVLDVASRSFGMAERAIAKDPEVNKAALALYKAPTKELMDTWVSAGWRTVYDKSNQPINEAYTEAQRQIDVDNLAKARNLVRKSLIKNNANLLDIVQAQLDGNPEQRAAVENLLIEEAVKITGRMQGIMPNFREVRMQAVSRLGGYLINNSPKFASLKDVVDEDQILNIPELRSKMLKAEVSQAISNMSEKNRIFAAREWLSQVGRQVLYGVEDPRTHKRVNLKIFPTPHSSAIIDRMLFTGRKENGIGGTILFGPPGTGKTEKAIAANLAEGYESRVIQIHHFTTFADLVGERVVQVGLDKSTSYLQRLTLAKQTFAGKSADECVQSLRDYYDLAVKEGKATERTFEDFISNYMVSENGVPTDNALIQTGFLRYLDTHIAGASLGKDTGDNFDGWVNGEVLTAINEGKRPIFDELDKAGKYSLGGVLTLLSRSPGDPITVGEKTIELPSWMKIHATANVLSLEMEDLDPTQAQMMKYLYDRFNLLEDTYPPVKDDLMVAAVKLSDRQGNFPLTAAEQAQMIAIYSILIPELRNLYVADSGMLPLTFRGTNELCNILVDTQTRERTPISIEKAVRMVLTENRPSAVEVDEALSRFYRIYQKPSATPLEPETPVKRPQARVELVESSIARILNSPLMRVMADYEVETLPFEDEAGFHRVILTEGQKLDIITARKEERGNELQPQTGLNLFITPTENGDYYYTLQADSDDIQGNPVILLESNKFSLDQPRLRAVDADGKTVVISVQEGPKDKKNERYLLQQMWTGGGNGSEIKSQYLPDEFGDFQLPKDGKSIFAISKKTNELQIIPTNSENIQTTNNWGILEGYTVKRMEVSGDSRFLLIEDLDGTYTRVFSIKRLRDFNLNSGTRLNADCMFKGTGFSFASPNLVVNPETNEGILITPKTDIDLWAKQ